MYDKAQGIERGRGLRELDCCCMWTYKAESLSLTWRLLETGVWCRSCSSIGATIPYSLNKIPVLLHYILLAAVMVIMDLIALGCELLS